MTAYVVGLLKFLSQFFCLYYTSFHRITEVNKLQIKSHLNVLCEMYKPMKHI